jgi:excisionase family DNA binding protein
MTPEQAADYLQVNRETIYRYIRQGKLLASRLGRAYRIPRRNLDLLLWSTRTRDDVRLREYSAEEIQQFVADDELTGAARETAEQFTTAMDQSTARMVRPARSTASTR